MATLNGIQSPAPPPVHALNITGKRKRAAISEEIDGNVPLSQEKSPSATEEDVVQLQELLEDILVVLQR